MGSKAFYCVEGHLPKFELKMARENFLLSWENVNAICASDDYLALSFDCEFGHVQFVSSESLTELFESFQMENLRMIDGRKLNCKMIKPE